jgi:hypothetical protein
MMGDSILWIHDCAGPGSGGAASQAGIGWHHAPGVPLLEELLLEEELVAPELLLDELLLEEELVVPELLLDELPPPAPPLEVSVPIPPQPETTAKSAAMVVLE